MTPSIVEHLDAGGLVLTDGGIETRLMYEPDVELDPHVQVAAMVDDPALRPRLAAIYRGYLAVAEAAGLAAVIGTPTFRASRRYADAAGMGQGAVAALNRSAVALHRQLREESGERPAWIAGVIGPQGDAYTPAEAPSADDAARYHAEQAAALADAGADLLYAPTFCSIEEAAGVTRAMVATGRPSVVSFVLDAGGRVLDGSTLAGAIDRIDGDVAPAFYSLSCIHPTVANRAVDALAADAPGLVARLREVKANASTLTPAELVALDHPDPGDVTEWADGMARLHERQGLQVLGGCCGTDDRHLAALAARLAEG